MEHHFLWQRHVRHARSAHDFLQFYAALRMAPSAQPHVEQRNRLSTAGRLRVGPKPLCRALLRELDAGEAPIQLGLLPRKSGFAASEPRTGFHLFESAKNFLTHAKISS